MSFNNSSFLTKFNEICRTCLKGGQLLTYLYDEENNINLVKKLNSTCTTIQFDKSDQMPDKICPTCIEELLQAYNFINKCQISDATLKKYFSNQSAIKIEDDPPVAVAAAAVTTNINIETDIVEAPAQSQPNQINQMKIEIFDESDADNQSDKISDISIKDEFLNLELEREFKQNVFKQNEFKQNEFKQNELKQMTIEQNPRKRKLIDDDEYTECSVDLSAKKIATTTTTTDDVMNVLINTDKLNSTFSVQSLMENSTDVEATTTTTTTEKFVRRTRSSLTGKENLIQSPYKNKKDSVPILKKYRYSCPACPASYMNPVGFLKHFQSHTGSQEKNQELPKKITKKNATIPNCQLCRQTFTNAANLITHYSEHIKNSTCEYCDNLFAVRYLSQHIQRLHAGLRRPYKCLKCEKKFTTAICLSAHKTEFHCPDKVHECAICYYTFDSLKEKRAHELEHLVGGEVASSSSSYTCHNCEAEFADAHLLIAHKVEKKCGKFYLCAAGCLRAFQSARDRLSHTHN